MREVYHEYKMKNVNTEHLHVRFCKGDFHKYGGRFKIENFDKNETYYMKAMIENDILWWHAIKTKKSPPKS